MRKFSGSSSSAVLTSSSVNISNSVSSALRLGAEVADPLVQVQVLDVAEVVSRSAGAAWRGRC